jgi:hypothetical protein
MIAKPQPQNLCFRRGLRVRKVIESGKYRFEILDTEPLLESIIDGRSLPPPNDRRGWYRRISRLHSGDKLLYQEILLLGALTYVPV